MSLEVLDVSGLATIQDSGRKGWRQFGVPTSGPMDSFAFQAANMLVSNSNDEAVIEIGLGDITFRALQDCVISVTGTGYQLSVYLWDFPLWSSYYVRRGWSIRFNKQDGGMWAYLAVSGGLQVQRRLGSRSTYLRGHFGGFNGRQLQAGDVITKDNISHAAAQISARTIAPKAISAYTQNPVLDVIMGPQTNYFTDKSLETFLSSEYSISLASDRMGYRLEGPALTHCNKTELISEGMTFGAIQIPSNGQPIIMMADCPTTGGYPKIGTVASADLPVFAQCVPNKGRIRFQETTVAKAQKRYRELINHLKSSIVEAD